MKMHALVPAFALVLSTSSLLLAQPQAGRPAGGPPPPLVMTTFGPRRAHWRL